MPTGKKTDINDDFTEKVTSIFHSVSDFFTKILHPTLTAEEVAHSCSDEIDKIILKYIHEGNTYGAGRFYIRWKDENTFGYSYVMYFRNPKGEAIEVSGENTVPLKFMAESDRNELREQRELAYEIDEPQLADVENANEISQ